jgi:hypothetical protein
VIPLPIARAQLLLDTVESAFAEHQVAGTAKDTEGSEDAVAM